MKAPPPPWSDCERFGRAGFTVAFTVPLSQSTSQSDFSSCRGRETSQISVGVVIIRPVKTAKVQKTPWSALGAASVLVGPMDEAGVDLAWSHQRPAAPAEQQVAGPSRATERTLAPLCRRQPGQMVSIVWLRRDLRLDDNPALNAALKTGGNVVRADAVTRRCGAPAAPTQLHLCDAPVR